MCLYLFWDCVILYYSASRYHSHVFILIAGWIQAVSHKKYHLISGNSLQLITIADDDKDKCDYMQVRYYLVSEGEGLVERSLEIENEYLTTDHQCTLWIERCHSAKYKIPNDKVKHWIITKTPTHVNIICNKVTVLNFDFNTDCDSDVTPDERVSWSGQLDSFDLDIQSEELSFVLQ